MSGKEYSYNVNIRWTGNKGSGTSDYRSYERSHIISVHGKPEIQASSDPAFRGDKTMYNPEELFLASLSSCHMLWFLHLCADNGIVVIEYVDYPAGIMIETEDGGGKFEEVTLHPTIAVCDESMISKIEELHKKANQLCFIANSVNFPVKHHVTVKIKKSGDE